MDDELLIKVNTVGHGLSVHAFTPKGQCIVIDLGSSPDRSPLNDLLAKNIKEIIRLIITHPHGDHFKEIELLDAFGFNICSLSRPAQLKRDQIIQSNQNYLTDLIDKYLAFSDRYNYPLASKNDITNPENTGGVKIRTFSPKPDSDNINDHSIVTLFEYLGKKVLVAGDNENKSWEYLLNDISFTNSIYGCEIFVVSHHGRKNGFYRKLFDYLSPSLCIVSDHEKGETSYINNYAQQSNGYIVTKRSKYESSVRKTLSTCNDGDIEISIGTIGTRSQYVMSVSVY